MARLLAKQHIISPLNGSINYSYGAPYEIQTDFEIDRWNKMITLKMALSKRLRFTFRR